MIKAYSYIHLYLSVFAKHALDLSPIILLQFCPTRLSVAQIKGNNSPVCLLRREILNSRSIHRIINCVI